MTPLSKIITFRENGTTEYNNQINHNEYGTHEFDFSTLSFIYGEERDPQTDFTPPELTSFDFISVSATKGDRVSINYEAFDTDSEIERVEFQFRNENNNTIYLYDYDDDGVASAGMEDWYSEELTRCIKFRSQTTNMMKIGLHTSQAEELSIMTIHSSQT